MNTSDTEFVARIRKRRIGWNNFHDSTQATFQRCRKPRRKPDFQSDSGSQYWKVPKGIIRCSDHWGSMIRSCSWYLDGKSPAGRFFSGKCDYINFGDLIKMRWDYAMKRDPIWTPLKWFEPHDLSRRHIKLSFNEVGADRDLLAMWEQIPSMHKFRIPKFYVVSEEAWAVVLSELNSPRLMARKMVDASVKLALGCSP